MHDNDTNPTTPLSACSFAHFQLLPVFSEFLDLFFPSMALPQTAGSSNVEVFRRILAEIQSAES